MSEFVPQPSAAPHQTSAATEGNATRHTAGPWTVGRYASGQLCIATADHDHIICNNVGFDTAKKDPRLRADARLIAAAPDLLEALKDAYEQFWHLAKDKENNPWLEQMRAAISKAESR